MQRALFFFLLFMITVLSGAAGAEGNATAPEPKPVQDPAAPVTVPSPESRLSSGKIPLDILGKGTDPNGTLLSYKLKEEIIASSLFELKITEKKKFVLHMLSQPEFPERPGLSSMYSIVLVYQEDTATLAYYLDQYQGQVHAEGAGAEMQKILEWCYATLKRYHYLLDE